MAEKKPDSYYTPPPKLGKWEGFKQFLWNSETSQFMGRTGASWGKFLVSILYFTIRLLLASVLLCPLAKYYIIPDKFTF